MKYRWLVFSFVGITTFLFGRGLLFAATFNIANGDVTALKNAIITSGGNGQDDIINLAAGGLYTLTTVDNNTDGNNGLPVLVADPNHSVTINGNGATIQRSTTAGTYFRILNVSCATSQCSDQETINDLSIVNGFLVSPAGGPGFSGGGFYLSNANVTLNNCHFTGNNSQFRGGGIGSAAHSLAINSCTFTNNTCDDSGAAVVNYRTLDALDCTFTGNHSVGPGAAVLNYEAGTPITTTLTNCTFDNNTRNVQSGADGGGICNLLFNSTANLTLTHCTIRLSDVSNTGILTIRNCILSNSTLFDGASGSFLGIHSDGYNLSDDDAGGNLTGPNDQTFTDPKLDPAPPQNNGGTTATIALLADSPALDHGQTFGVGLDQRDQFRPRDLSFVTNGPGSDGADVGAFEAIEPRQGGPIFVVNTSADHDDGVCGGGDCTLREAVAAANVATNANMIAFAANVTGTITLNSSLGQLNVTNPVTISGPGARILAIAGGNATRVLSFSAGTSVLSGLTIRNGRATSTFSASGGGVANSATLFVNDCAFLNNQVLGGNATTAGGTGSNGRGGAMANVFGGTLTLNRCTFGGNNATGGTGGINSGTNPGGTGGAGQGGAVLNDPACTFAINNCTFVNNTANGGAGGDNTSPHAFGGDGGRANGAAIFNGETMTVTACTISGNTGVGGAGGTGNGVGHDGQAGVGTGGLENNGSSSSTVRNTISAGNSGNGGRDAAGNFISQGYNLIGVADFSTGFNATGDQIGTSAAPLNAMLGALQNNGGPTDTMALLTNSPAIDQGKSFSLTNDQRSRTRPLDNPAIAPASGGDNSDIGAFESTGNLFPYRAVSRKTHGTAGLAYDVDLPLTGPIGIECRSGGTTNDYLLSLNFLVPITINGTPKAQVTTGVGVVGSGGTANPNLVTVNNGTDVNVFLTNVGNAQRIVVTLKNVSDGTYTNDIAIPVGMLLGDTTGDGSVNSGDIAQTKSQSGQVVSNSNFRQDVTADRSLNSSDIALVKSKSGTGLLQSSISERADR